MLPLEDDYIQDDCLHEASLPSFCVQAMPMNDIPQAQSARGAIGIDFCQGWLDPLCVNTAFVTGGEPCHSVYDPHSCATMPG